MQVRCPSASGPGSWSFMCSTRCLPAAAIHQFDLLGDDGQQEWRSFVDDHVPASVNSGSRLERVLSVAASPSAEIIRGAESRGVDLFVMGTRAVEPLDRSPLWASGELAETYPTGL